MGATSIYMATVAAQHQPLVCHHQRHNQRQRTGTELGREFLARRHFGCTPLFIAAQNAAMEAPSPTM